MYIINDVLNAHNSIESVQSIGFFDGVHLGHRYVLSRLRAEAQRRHLSSMVITFRQHPKSVLSPENPMPLLTTLDEKLHLLEQEGIDQVALLDFTPQMAGMSACEFMQDILCGQLKGKALLIGYDHHFGRRCDGEGFEQYQTYGKRLGMEVIQMSEFSDRQLRLSSTLARKALAEGNVEGAAQILGRPYRLSGKVVEGNKIGRSIGFPTANIAIGSEQKLLPKDGAYAVKARLGGSALFNGMLYIGRRPTIHNSLERRIEVNLLDFDGEIYGEMLDIDFIGFIRDQQQFSSLELLKDQLLKDQLTALEILKR